MPHLGIARSHRSVDHRLRLCPTHLSCGVCQLYGQDKEKLAKIRDLFLQNVPGWLISKMYNIPLRTGRNYHLLRHAWRHNWYKDRVLQVPFKKITQIAILARLRDSWDQVTPQTADKMLALLEKLSEGKREVVCPYCGGMVQV